LVPGRTAVMCTPFMPTELVLGTGYQSVAVKIPAQVLETTLDALTGVARREPLRFEFAIDTRTGGGASALRMLEFIMREAEAATDDTWRFAGSRLADAFVCTLLGGLRHNHSRLLERAPTLNEPAYVRRAEEFIEANADRPLSVADLAAAAGVGVRSLSGAFRAHRGESPMAFLQTRRFARARQRLLSGLATSVTEVAFSSGFQHLGRFSVGYRARFGESA